MVEGKSVEQLYVRAKHGVCYGMIGIYSSPWGRYDSLSMDDSSRDTIFDIFKDADGDEVYQS